jgi:hypothetical protein
MLMVLRLMQAYGNLIDLRTTAVEASNETHP